MSLTFVQTHRLYNAKNELQYKLWALGGDVCQSRFINCNKYTTLKSDGGNEGGYTCMSTGDLREISVPSPSFCCEPKIALKKYKYLNMKKKVRSINSQLGLNSH